MDAERLRRIRERAERQQRSSIDSWAHLGAETLELVAENERLRGAIIAHREANGGFEMPCPHELRWANRQLWATVEEK